MRNTKNKTAPEAAFKFKELKVYNSTEYLWENVKKYRQVFDRSETAYIYTELSLYNKLFDVEDWSLQVNLKCFLVEENDRQEICNLTIEKEISKFDHLIYLREGWGNKRAGTFWKKGTYYWDAYVDDVKIGTKYFYVIESHDDAFDEGSSAGSTSIPNNNTSSYRPSASMKAPMTTSWRPTASTSASFPSRKPATSTWN